MDKSSKICGKMQEFAVVCQIVNIVNPATATKNLQPYQ